MFGAIEITILTYAYLQILAGMWMLSPEGEPWHGVKTLDAEMKQHVRDVVTKGLAQKKAREQKHG